MDSRKDRYCPLWIQQWDSIVVFIHRGGGSPQNIEFNVLLYIQAWGECPRPDATLWIFCSVVDHAHSSGGRPQKGFGGTLGFFWCLRSLLGHDCCLSCQCSWACYDASEGMNTLRLMCECPGQEFYTWASYVREDSGRIRSIIPHGRISYGLFPSSGSNPSLLLNPILCGTDILPPNVHQKTSHPSAVWLGAANLASAKHLILLQMPIVWALNPLAFQFLT